MLEVAEHFTQVWAERSTTLTTLANRADLVLTGIAEQGLAANVRDYYGDSAGCAALLPSRSFASPR